MPSKSWHRDRINELEFIRNKKLSFTDETIIASILAGLFIYGLGNRNPLLAILSFVTFMFVAFEMLVIKFEVKKNEEQKIQNNYDVLLDRKTKKTKK